MSWLMPALTREIKQAENSITLLVPFFEADGFSHLEDVLLAALERGVEVTFVSRYLMDSDSYNRTVLKSFAERAEDRDVEPALLRFVDYTQWDADVPQQQRRQSGATPAFTLHSKVIVFDNSKAYVGSANVTDYGFEHYLETGILLEGPPVDSFRDLVWFLFESDAASSVSLLD
ncbi:hypothetical protein GQS65_19675 [Halomarina oriensis]|uniref:PLD phosphodiesterase domain-containing protein n=2 Tax=Halomarina oriensis TaxID=671145 RepID=A0A6B0GY18_9EURY|nr:phospholipase D-like domain-containing protein [Halomarina oriensis]MWG36678.1 hypothetical protein [Halomarina oriensis]